MRKMAMRCASGWIAENTSGAVSKKGLGATTAPCQFHAAAFFSSLVAGLRFRKVQPGEYLLYVPRNSSLSDGPLWSANRFPRVQF